MWRAPDRVGQAVLFPSASVQCRWQPAQRSRLGRERRREGERRGGRKEKRLRGEEREEVVFNEDREKRAN